MVLVVEMTEQTKAVELVLVISIVQTLEKLQLLQTSLVPAIMYNLKHCATSGLFNLPIFSTTRRLRSDRKAH